MWTRGGRLFPLQNCGMDQQTNTFIYRFGRREYDLSARTYIMGILNMTPDSFSDGGRYLDAGEAVDHSLRMISDGADIIDVGGESTRPKSAAYRDGAEPVPVEEELRRVIPVIEALAPQTDVPISIDTYKAIVAEKALDAGALMVNDISGFMFDPEMAPLVAERGASVVLMHIKGTPKTMQLNPTYADLFGEVKSYLAAGLHKGKKLGIKQMIVDPGIGFGKTVEHNLQLLRGLGQLRELGYPVMIGPSRKSFLGTILDLPVEERLEGTLAACVAGILQGANIIRVHDVKQAKRAARIADAIKTTVV